MRSIQSRVPAPKMPRGLVELMEELARDVLRHNPTNVEEFCARHVEQLLIIRDGKTPTKPLSLEQKIKRAQDRVREKAKQRRRKYDEEMKKYSQNEIEQDTSLNSVEQEDSKAHQENKSAVIEENGSVELDKEPKFKAPVHHEQDLAEALEIEIFHKPVAAAFKSLIENNDSIDDSPNVQDNASKQAAELSDSVDDTSVELMNDNSKDKQLKTSDCGVISENTFSSSTDESALPDHVRVRRSAEFEETEENKEQLANDVLSNKQENKCETVKEEEKVFEELIAESNKVRRGEQSLAESIIYTDKAHESEEALNAGNTKYDTNTKTEEPVNKPGLDAEKAKENVEDIESFTPKLAENIPCFDNTDENVNNTSVDTGNAQESNAKAAETVDVASIFANEVSVTATPEPAEVNNDSEQVDSSYDLNGTGKISPVDSKSNIDNQSKGVETTKESPNSKGDIEENAPEPYSYEEPLSKDNTKYGETDCTDETGKIGEYIQTRDSLAKSPPIADIEENIELKETEAIDTTYKKDGIHLNELTSNLTEQQVIQDNNGPNSESAKVNEKPDRDEKNIEVFKQNNISAEPNTQKDKDDKDHKLDSNEHKENENVESEAESVINVFNTIQTNDNLTEKQLTADDNVSNTIPTNENLTEKQLTADDNDHTGGAITTVDKILVIESGEGEDDNDSPEQLETKISNGFIMSNINNNHEDIKADDENGEKSPASELLEPATESNNVAEVREEVTTSSEPSKTDIETSSMGKSSSTDDSITEEGRESGAEIDTIKPDTESSNQKETPSVMDLETAAVTIQKVFRTFLFKSRESTFDDTGNEGGGSMDGDLEETEVEYQLNATPMNKERRTLGISRMDTVLQTVNEEKSLSLSTDDSSLSSAATVIQAHVRGYLLRNRLNSNKTSSSTSLVNSDGPSSEHDVEQKANKTVLNIHIVPEGHYLRDESLLTSMELSLDGSPPSSTNLHPLGYDKSEPRKQLKREDAIQSISPPSNNSGKLSEDSVKEMPISDLELQKDGDVSPSKPRRDIDTDNRDNTPTKSTSIETVIEAHKVTKDDSSSLEPKKEDVETAVRRKQSPMKMSSDENDVVTPYEEKSSKDSDATSGLLHSGEFHDCVLPTKVSRGDTSVVRGE